MWISLYAATTFLSAFLLFAVQPMLAKAILPWFGGTAAVWTVCLMFFQALLLLGYLYAHASSRYLPPKAQPFLHLALLALSLLWLPALPDASWKPMGGDDPTIRIVRLLLATVGLPYLLLSSTGSLLQAWYVRQRPDLQVRGEGEKKGKAAAGAGVYPYWLYAVSNTGSLLALLSYPVGVEPLLALPQQAWVWSGGYVLFALLCGGVALGSLKGLKSGAPITGEGSLAASAAPSPTLRQYLMWAGLVFTSTTLLLAVTSHLTQNVAPVPFLWVVPLSLYLLSFILVFGSKGWQWSGFWRFMTPLALLILGFGATEYSRGYSYLILLPLYVFGFFFACVLCHGELSRTKPDPAYLTSYYLMVSLGGAVGGLFVGILAPLLFEDYYELPLSIALCAVVALFALYSPSTQRWRHPGWVAAALTTLAFLVFLGNQTLASAMPYRVSTRNFYGVLRVFDYSTPETGELRRVLQHGTIFHGMQILEPKEGRRVGTTYFGEYSGGRLAFSALEKQPNARIGIIGLGAGTLAVYPKKGDTVRFYEINPEVARIAQSEFTFLKDCRGKVEIALGDARLTLEREPPQGYDVFVVDAFSSDSIPTHLLTKEAMQLYFRHLKPDGILAIHTSNSYLNLKGVVKKLADELGKQSRSVLSSQRPAEGIEEAEWILVTNRPGFFNTGVMPQAGQPIPPQPDLRVWTDNYSNLLQIMQ